MVTIWISTNYLIIKIPFITLPLEIEISINLMIFIYGELFEDGLVANGITWINFYTQFNYIYMVLNPSKSKIIIKLD
jgi:hypothetical protein